MIFYLFCHYSYQMVDFGHPPQKQLKALMNTKKKEDRFDSKKETSRSRDSSSTTGTGSKRSSNNSSDSKPSNIKLADNKPLDDKTADNKSNVLTKTTEKDNIFSPAATEAKDKYKSVPSKQTIQE